MRATAGSRTTRAGTTRRQVKTCSSSGATTRRAKCPSARSAGGLPELVQRPKGRAQAHQRQGRDGLHAADLPRGLRAAAVHPPVDGFFEWKAAKGERAKQPFASAMQHGSPFGIAGLWENWKDQMLAPAPRKRIGRLDAERVARPDPPFFLPQPVGGPGVSRYTAIISPRRRSGRARFSSGPSAAPRCGKRAAGDEPRGMLTGDASRLALP
jgi:SOS response associated peptidase (SRAP)